MASAQQQLHLPSPLLSPCPWPAFPGTLRSVSRPKLPYAHNSKKPTPFPAPPLFPTKQQLQRARRRPLRPLQSSPLAVRRNARGKYCVARSSPDVSARCRLVVL
ncbi:hypothetical protein Zm00014a_005006 [Zea mays]|uniref:Uncharacterized protein n=1 Tax=Zea mays TaxID=4577 RepID=A0A3L6DSE4_MAIZE|nr:hypothetical protein Zm00014a_005006 [Zea mays]